MRRKTALIFSSLICISMMIFSLTACGHRDLDAYQEGVYSFTKTSEISDEELLLCNDRDLHIETVSMTFNKIGLIEYKKADGKNVIKNSRDLKKYHVDLFIKFAEENEGRYYDFVFDGSKFFLHNLTVSLNNEALGIGYDKLFVVHIEYYESYDETGIFFSWFTDENSKEQTNSVFLMHK